MRSPSWPDSPLSCNALLPTLPTMLQHGGRRGKRALQRKGGRGRAHPNDHTISSVGTAAVTASPGWSTIRNASPSASGSASEDRVSAPPATNTCWRGSSGRMTVSPAPSRATRSVAAPTRTTSTSRPGSSSTARAEYAGGVPGSSGVSQAWTKRTGPSGPASSEWVTPVPADSTCTTPGVTTAEWPAESSCRRAPESTQVTISRSRCGWLSKPAPAPSRWSSWQTSGPNETLSGS
ncbi:hypothetical protein Noca_4588 [Nocardioides sp. JS614]|nr:hypothetical protein Noca_4588 [Nocardioides sp. JS614]